MKEKIQNILAVLLQIEPDLIHDGFSQETVEGWDSLLQMNLIVSIEEEFGIEFNEEEALLTDGFESLCELVERKLQLRQAV